MPRSSRALRVTHLCGGTLTGCSRVVLNLLARHDRSRVEPSACYFAVLPPDREILDETDRIGARWESVVKRSRYEPASIWRLSRALARLSPDVVVAHGFGTYTFAAPAAKLARIKTLIRVEHNPELYGRSHRIAARYTAGLYDSSIAVSAYLLEYLRAQGVTLEKPEVIYNGIDLSAFADIDRPPFSNMENPPVLLMAARLDTQKDHATLIDAVGILSKRGVALRLRLAGTGPLRDELENRAERLGIASSVEFLGYRADMAALIAAADIGVLSTHYEGFGLAVVEAMAGGRPVVATRVASIPEILSTGEHGFLVEPGSAESLAEALMKLLRAPEGARKMGLAGRASARARFDLDTSVRHFERHILRTVDEKTRG